MSIDALDYEHNHDAQTQSPRLTTATLQLDVGRRGLGPREHGEQNPTTRSIVLSYLKMASVLNEINI